MSVDWECVVYFCFLVGVYWIVVEVELGFVNVLFLFLKCC